jgi:hypothetical protein
VVSMTDPYGRTLGFLDRIIIIIIITKTMSSVRERTISTERPPFVGEVIANLCE